MTTDDAKPNRLIPILSAAGIAIVSAVVILLAALSNTNEEDPATAAYVAAIEARGVEVYDADRAALVEAGRDLCNAETIEENRAVLIRANLIGYVNAWAELSAAATEELCS